ncbi:MAG TPA: CoA-transferase [Actinomycetota bacterium]|nr:CoA-transferase [Actinomycetota bacterium]
MDEELRSWIERRFAVRAPARSKLTSLREAVAEGVAPGDTVHLGMTHTRGSAAFWELIRAFAETKPNLTLLGVAMSSPLSPLVHAGLASKLVTSWAGDSYWTPGPNGVYQRAWQAGIPIEQWSILTFTQRLAAGARGLATTTTRSLRGSSMMSNDGVRMLDEETVLIPSLVPDVSIFHAAAADEYGNVLFAPPLMENVYGALAARKGCIVTVDRIVDPAFIRAHAHMTLLPQSAVRAVVEVPFGAHPGGLVPSGIEGVQGYGEDYDFWIDIRRAARDPAAMDAWIKEWIFEADTPEKYRDRLGVDRVEALKRRIDPRAYEEELADAVSHIDFVAAPSAVETAVVLAGRELATRIRDNGYTSMLAGAGMANLAAWLAAYALADQGVSVDLMAEMGLIGYWPRPGEPILFNQRNFPTCTMLADIDRTLSILVGGGAARSIGALGAAQVDRHGNINSTEIPGSQMLMGSGGANDVITCAGETLLIVAQSAERLVEEVSYITGPGDRVETLVTTMGLYRKDRGEFVLAGVFGDDRDEAAKECIARCGWDLRVARDLQILAAPAPDEIMMLRVMDPSGWFRA